MTRKRDGEIRGPSRTRGISMSKLKLLMTALAVTLFVAAFQLQSAPPVAAAAAPSEAGTVLHFAASQLNKPFRLGANGMRCFDCSGLVYRTFREEGLASRIGGPRPAARHHNNFRKPPRVTPHPPKRGLGALAPSRPPGSPPRHFDRL